MNGRKPSASSQQPLSPSDSKEPVQESKRSPRLRFFEGKKLKPLETAPPVPAFRIADNKNKPAVTAPAKLGSALINPAKLKRAETAPTEFINMIDSAGIVKTPAPPCRTPST